MGSFSSTHMIILFLIVLVIFGPKNLPKIGQALGRGIREFKDAARGMNADVDDEEYRPVRRKQEIDEQPDQPPDTVSRSSTATADAQEARKSEPIDLPGDDSTRS